MTHVITLAPGTPIRTDNVCPNCGWDDVWETAVHSLSAAGVGTIAKLRNCARCSQRDSGELDVWGDMEGE